MELTLPFSSLAISPINSTVERGPYSTSSRAQCRVRADSSRKVSQIWFTTPVLKKDDIHQIKSIQLVTTAHHQGFIDNIDDGLWSWFELVILEGPGATKPRLTADNKPMVFYSHSIPADAVHDQEQQGNILERGTGLFAYLEPGNIIGVRVCAQYPAWENVASQGSLLVQMLVAGGNTVTSANQTAQTIPLGSENKIPPDIPITNPLTGTGSIKTSPTGASPTRSFSTKFELDGRTVSFMGTSTISLPAFEGQATLSYSTDRDLTGQCSFSGTVGAGNFSIVVNNRVTIVASGTITGGPREPLDFAGVGFWGLSR